LRQLRKRFKKLLRKKSLRRLKSNLSLKKHQLNRLRKRQRSLFKRRSKRMNQLFKLQKRLSLNP